MDPVQVSLLGPLRIVVGDAEFEVRGRIPRRLITRLLLADGGAVAADELIDAGWSGDCTVETLRVQLSRLRRLLDRSGIEIASTTRGWQLRGDFVDARHTARGASIRLMSRRDPALAASSAADLVSMWTGPSLTDARDEHWAMPEAVGLDAVRDGARRRHAEALSCAGQPALATAAWVTLVAEWPYDEAAAQWLAATMAASGRSTEAIAELHALRIRLREGVGCDPDAETAALERALLEHHPDPLARLRPSSPLDRSIRAVPVQPAPREIADRSPPHDLVGRRSEWDALLELGGPTGASIALVRGPEGVGKTALVTAVADRAVNSPEALLLRMACRDGQEEPFAPVAAMLRSVGDAAMRSLADDEPIISALMSARSGDVADPRPEPIGHALARLLATITERRSVVLVIDDLHWASDALAVAVEHLLGDLVDGRTACRVLLATRPIKDGSPALQRVSTIAGRHGALIDIGGLDADDVITLGARRGLALTPAEAEALVGLTGGNPLFLREALNSWGEGIVAAASTPLDGVTVPPLVSLITLRRIRSLPSSSRALLDAIACWLEPAPVRALRSVLDLDSDEFWQALDDLIDADLVREDVGESVRMAHAYFELAVRSQLAPHARRRTHRRIADALIGAEGSSDDRSEPIAHHLVAAGVLASPSETVTWLLRAAERLRSQGAFDAARARVVSAKRLVAPADLLTLASACAILQRIEANVGAVDASKAAGRQAIDLCLRAGSVHEAVGSLVLHCSYGIGQREDPESLALTEIVRSAIDETTTMSPREADALRSRVDSCRAFHIAMWLGDATVARPVATAAFDAGAASADVVAIGEAAFAVAISSLGLPDPPLLQSAISELRRNGLRSGRLVDTARSWRMEGLLALHRGDREALTAAIDALDRLGREPGLWHVLADAARWRSADADACGRHDEAATAAGEQRRLGFGGAPFEGSYVAQRALQRFERDELTISDPVFPVLIGNRTAGISVAALRAVCLLRASPTPSSAQVSEAMADLDALVDALGPEVRNRNHHCDLVMLAELALELHARGAPVHGIGATLLEWTSPFGGLHAVAGYGEHVFGAIDRWRARLSAMNGDDADARRLAVAAMNRERRAGWLARAARSSALLGEVSSA